MAPAKAGWLKKMNDAHISLKKWKHKWFIINDHMLYYFNHPSEVVNGNARCLIPLQNLRVGTSEIDDPTGCTFQMVDSNGGPIKTMKGGQMGQHTRLVLRAETKEDC